MLGCRMRKVSFSKPALTVIEKELKATEHSGEEKCAIMLGSSLSQTQWEVKDVIPVENIAHKADRFAIDPEELYQILAPNNKWSELLGFFHTHPTESNAYPSQTDMEFMKLWPTPYLWAIGSYREGKFQLQVYVYDPEFGVLKVPTSVY